LQLFATFSIFTCNFLLQFLSSITQNLSVKKKDTSKLFKLVLIFFDCMKNSYMTD